MSLLRKLFGAVLIIASLVMLVVFVATPLDVRPQLVLGGILIVFAFLVSRLRGQSELVTHVLMMLSFAASSRYIYWRISSTLDFDSWLDYLFGYLVMAAELYAYVVLLLGFFQSMRVLDRKPLPLPPDPKEWPTIDVFVPTYSEPLDVVRPTVLAALNLDWPRDKLNVYLLDDGRRPEMRDFAAKAKCHYVIRPDNKHAKAGNINHALKVTKGELIAIFDCDHMPARSFLQLTVGWFLKDAKLGMMQTPHHFYNADPIERNTGVFRQVPNEGELFYSYLQAGNDFWNATFFCGSCAVIRRATLESIGGMATYSITEDALTSLCFQRKGWNTAYLNLRQAGGLATDTLAAHVTQRIRWAQGMAQILRTNNPMLGRGLKLGQRLCYLAAMLHFFYGLPRLVFLAGPLAYLLFGAHVCNASAAMLAVYVGPHLAHAIISNSRLKGKFRYSFWDNVYEAVLAPYILWPTTLAMLNPKAGSFKVTDKGVLTEKGGFDKKISRPYQVMLFFVLLGVMFALARLLLWDFYDTGTVLINLGWVTASCISLGMTIGIAFEDKQRRRTHRVEVKLPGMMETEGGHTVTIETRNLSLGGARLRLDEPQDITEGARIEVTIFAGDREATLPGVVKAVDKGGSELRVQWDGMSLRQESSLVQVLFGRPDVWLDWDKARPPDNPIASMTNLIRRALRSIRRMAAAMQREAVVAMIIILAATLVFLLMHTGWRFMPVVDRFVALGQLIVEKTGALLRG